MNFDSVSYSCIILCKSLNVFVLQFPHLQNECHNMYLIGLLRGLNEIMQVKFYAQNKHLTTALLTISNKWVAVFFSKINPGETIEARGKTFQKQQQPWQQHCEKPLQILKAVKILWPGVCRRWMLVAYCVGMARDISDRIGQKKTFRALLLPLPCVLLV